MKIPIFPPDLKEFLRLLIAHRVRFIIVGGYCVAYHGHPRFTGDLDIWVDKNKYNAEAVVNTLKEFGFDTPNLSSDLFLKDDCITRMGVEPMKIEIFTHIPGLKFEESYPRISVYKSDIGDIPFLSLDDLKISKRTSGRHKDLADLEELS